MLAVDQKQSTQLIQGTVAVASAQSSGFHSLKRTRCHRSTKKHVQTKDSAIPAFTTSSPRLSSPVMVYLGGITCVAMSPRRVTCRGKSCKHVEDEDEDEHRRKVYPSGTLLGPALGGNLPAEMHDQGEARGTHLAGP